MFSVIGIDMALLNTGLVEIFSDGSFVRSTLFCPVSKGYRRVVEIVRAVSDFVAWRGCNKDSLLVGIEDYVIGRGFKTGMDVLKAQGAVVYGLHKFGVPVIMVHPARLRHFQRDGYKSGLELSCHEEDAWGLATLVLATKYKDIMKGWDKPLVEIVRKLKSVF